MLRLPPRGGSGRRGPRAPVPRHPHHLRRVPRGRPSRRVPGVHAMSVLLLLIAAAAAPAPAPRSPAVRASMDTRCEGCHSVDGWRRVTFDHSKTGFPLEGQHITTSCLTCHQQDYARTVGTAIDHLRAGFGTDCRSCHFPTRFKGATFPAHNLCFQITGGPHAGISCLDCNSSLASFTPTGTCTTNTA